MEAEERKGGLVGCVCGRTYFIVGFDVEFDFLAGEGAYSDIPIRLR